MKNVLAPAKLFASLNLADQFLFVMSCMLEYMEIWYSAYQIKAKQEYPCHPHSPIFPKGQKL